MRTPGLARSIIELLRWKILDRDMDEEMRLHIQLETEQLIADGLPPAEARRRALLEFGGVDRFKEEARDGRGLRWIHDFAVEARQAARRARSRPLFTFAAIAVLALGLAGSTGILGLAEAALRRPPPFATPDRLYMLTGSDRGEATPVSWTELQDWAEFSEALEEVSAYKESTVSLTEPGATEEVPVEQVSWNYFEIVGARAAAGRTFYPGDEAVGASGGVVISHALWEERLGADPEIVGRFISIDETPTEVLGVTEPGFSGLSLEARMWVPAAPQPEFRATVDYSWLYGVARARPGVPEEALADDLVRTARATQERWPGLERGIAATSLSDHYLGRRRAILGLLSAGVLILLVLGWLGVGSMLTASTVARGPELGMRVALGASRGRILAGLLAQSLLMVVPAAALGLVGGIAFQRAFLALAPDGAIPAWVDVRLSGTMLLVMLGLTAGTVVFITAFAAAWAGRTGAATAAGNRMRGGQSASSMLEGLAIAQVAVSLALLAASGHVLLEYRAIAGIDPGVRPDVLVGRVSMSQENSQGESWVRAVRALLDDLAGRPAVVAAAVTSDAPMRGLFSYGVFGAAEGREIDITYYRHRTSPGYFETVGLPIVAGRDIAWSDREGTPPVAVVSAALADALWPGEEALGRFLPGGQEIRVVGVVGNARTLALVESLDDSANGHDVYLPAGQQSGANFDIVARGSGDPLELAPAVRAALASADPRATLYTVTSIGEMVSLETAADRLGAYLMIAFAVQALLITAAGIYGLLAFLGAHRRREVAIRLAVGGSPRQVGGRVVRGALRLGALGAGAGVLAVVATTAALQGISARPLILAAGAAIVLLVVAAASLGPALQASRVQPAELLRAD